MVVLHARCPFAFGTFGRARYLSETQEPPRQLDHAAADASITCFRKALLPPMPLAFHKRSRRCVRDGHHYSRRSGLWPMVQTGEGWRVIDVLADGTMSNLATRRSDFRSTLLHGSGRRCRQPAA